MMLASVLRASAVMALIATMGAEHARRSLADGHRDTSRSIPPPFSTEGPAIFDIGAVGTATPDSLRGVEVVAQDVCVSELTDRGFWARPDPEGARVFVHAAEGRLISVRVGELVTVHGEVRLAMNPIALGPAAREADRRVGARPIPYVYAYTVRPAWPRRNQGAAPTPSDMCGPLREGDGAPKPDN
jgi:hypothetical protein